MPNFRQVYLREGADLILWGNSFARVSATLMWNTEFRPVSIRASSPNHLFWSKDWTRIEFSPSEIYDWSSTMSILNQLVLDMAAMQVDLATFLSTYKGRTLLNGTDTKNVLQKTWTNTFAVDIDPDDTITIAHGVSDPLLIENVLVVFKSSTTGQFSGVIAGVPSAANVGLSAGYDATNITITQVQSTHRSQPYGVVLNYREA